LKKISFGNGHLSCIFKVRTVFDRAFFSAYTFEQSYWRYRLLPLPFTFNCWGDRKRKSMSIFAVDQCETNLLCFKREKRIFSNLAVKYFHQLIKAVTCLTRRRVFLLFSPSSLNTSTRLSLVRSVERRCLKEVRTLRLITEGFSKWR